MQVTTVESEPEINLRMSWQEAQCLKIILNLVREVNSTVRIDKLLTPSGIRADTFRHTAPVQELGKNILQALENLGVAYPR